LSGCLLLRTKTQPCPKMFSCTDHLRRVTINCHRVHSPCRRSLASAGHLREFAPKQTPRTWQNTWQGIWTGLRPLLPCLVWAAVPPVHPKHRAAVPPLPGHPASPEAVAVAVAVAPRREETTARNTCCASTSSPPRCGWRTNCQQTVTVRRRVARVTCCHCEDGNTRMADSNGDNDSNKDDNRATNDIDSDDRRRQWLCCRCCCCLLLLLLASCCCLPVAAAACHIST
jgi:hypothetical protein